MCELKKFILNSSAIADIVRYDSGTAVITNKPYTNIFWFDVNCKLIFSTEKNSEFKAMTVAESNIHIYKINEWLKIYTSSGKSAKILVEKRDYLMPLGSYFPLHNQSYSDFFKNITVKENAVLFGEKKVQFKNNINDVVYMSYPQEYVLITANSKGQSCSDNWCTLYCFNMKGDFVWQIEDYSARLDIPTEPINRVYIDNQCVIAQTLCYEFVINSQNGKVESFGTHRW